MIPPEPKHLIPHVRAKNDWGAVVFVGIIWFGRMMAFQRQGHMPIYVCMFGLLVIVLGILKLLMKYHSYNCNLVYFVISVTAISVMSAELEDTIFRQRCLAALMISWREHALSRFSEHPRKIITAALALSLVEWYCTWWAYQKDNLEMPFRVWVTTAALTIRVGIFIFPEGRRLQMLHLVLDELTEQNSAQESLISMLCDCSVRVAVDGDTLLRSSPHFDSLMQQTAEGTSLLSHILGKDHERSRIAEAFGRAKQTPVALPVTFVSKELIPRQADVFIVRRRELDSLVSSSDVGFLVGIRFEQVASQVLPPASEVVSQEIPRLLEARGWDRAASLGLVDEGTSVVVASRQAQLASSAKKTLPTGHKLDDGKSRRSSSAPPRLSSCDDCHQQDAADQATASVRSGLASQHTDWSFLSWRPICKEILEPDRAQIKLAQYLPAHFALGSDKDLPSSSNHTNAAKIDAHSQISDMTQEESVDSIDSSSSSWSEIDACVKFGYVPSPGQPQLARLSDFAEMKSQGMRSIGSCHSPRGDHAECLPCSFHFGHMYMPERRPCKASYLCEYCHDVNHHPQWRSALRKHRPPVNELTSSKAVEWLWARRQSTRSRHPAGASSASSAHKLTRIFVPGKLVKTPQPEN